MQRITLAESAGFCFGVNRAVKLLEDSKQRQHLYERAVDNKIFAAIRENVKLEEQEIAMADFEKLFQK